MLWQAIVNRQSFEFKKGGSLGLLVIIGGYPDIGKGTLTAVSGYLLQRAGLRVAPIKYDGFLNRQPGLLPDYHSRAHFQYANEEIFALEDGWAADNDLGYHERFMDVALKRTHQLTNGEAFEAVFERENSAYYPTGEILNFNHVRDVLKEWILGHLETNELVVLELGGTVGDRESEVMFDAVQGLRRRGEHVIAVALAAPYFPTSDAQGFAESRCTKLARQSAGMARKLGLPPDVILLRASKGVTVSASDRKYIAFEVGLDASRIMACPYTKSVYELPSALIAQGFASVLGELFGIDVPVTDGPLEEYCRLQSRASDVLKVALPGKNRPSDSQVSLEEALTHAATRRGALIERVWLEDLAESDSASRPELKGIDALVVPDVLADTSLVTRALRLARETSLPTLAISHGADLMVLEFARNVCGAEQAFIEELEEGQGDMKIFQAAPACGKWPVYFKPDSLLARLYLMPEIIERSRHNSWASESLVHAVQERGLMLTGVGRDGTPETFELPGHPFFIAMKPRPEYQSRPMRPNAPFLGLIDAALARRKRAKESS